MVAPLEVADALERVPPTWRSQRFVCVMDCLRCPRSVTVHDSPSATPPTWVTKSLKSSGQTSRLSQARAKASAAGCARSRFSRSPRRRRRRPSTPARARSRSRRARRRSSDQLGRRLFTLSPRERRHGDARRPRRRTTATAGRRAARGAQLRLLRVGRRAARWRDPGGDEGATCWRCDDRVALGARAERRRGGLALLARA